MTFEDLFVNPKGRTSRGQFVGALIPLLLAGYLYGFLVTGRVGQWSLLMLLFPAIVLHARRLHDMGRTAWLLLIPVALIAGSIWLRMVSNGSQIEVAVTMTALVVAAAVMLWGLIGKGEAAANRFGDAAVGASGQQS
jgi:uncharacterized membrane protein YhaH (DUF805 family)